MSDINHPDAELLAVAQMNAHDCELLRADLATALVPQSQQRPSEAMLAFIRRDARAIHDGLVKALSGSETSGSETVPPVSSADLRMFFSDPALFEFLISRHAYCELEKKLARDNDTPLSQTLPAQLLDAADHNLADCGQAILAASGPHRRGSAASWQELPAELLHRAVWRMVSQLEIDQPDRSRPANDNLRNTARQLLANYSEDQQLQTSARKFLTFAGESFADQQQDIGTAGLAIFCAALATELRISFSHVIRLLAAPSFSAFAILQRAAAIPQDRAMANIFLLHGFDLTPSDVSMFERDYSQITVDAAAQVAFGWHIARLHAAPKIGEDAI